MDIRYDASSGNTQADGASESSVAQAEQRRKTLIDILQGIDDLD